MALKINTPQYVGDGVYAEHDGFQVWIWTSNGIEASPRIALNPDTFLSLYQFVRQDANFMLLEC